MRPVAPGVGEPVQLFNFDIPAQPLDSALDQFSATSGRSALVSSLLVAGRTASPVRGRYTSVAALRLLIEDTGLEAEEVSAGSVVALVLKPAGPQALAAAAAARSSKERLASYDGLVQASIWRAICANPRTGASGYRALLQFQVDPGGRIRSARVLSTSGNKGRDTTLLEVLHRVRISQPPPMDLPQPLLMLILPGQIDGPACDPGAT
ncbi:TonB family protein [Cupriavidus basilensis]|uniref:TonB family protein n=1 Tax=Cupriavidus basilensis TaxID=68895 RepID=UPI003D32CB10